MGPVRDPSAKHILETSSAKDLLGPTLELRQGCAAQALGSTERSGSSPKLASMAAVAIFTAVSAFAVWPCAMADSTASSGSARARSVSVTMGTLDGPSTSGVKVLPPPSSIGFRAQRTTDFLVVTTSTHELTRIVRRLEPLLVYKGV